ncbi:MAG TPA: M23 family metallopeptidase [Candidatus Dormibacteraeota bacterium]|nr:M23 family metallopeptidase [Candidatus Dormibacteraeota bacterium]
MRLLAIVALGVTVWLVAATQVPVHIRLPVEAVVIGATVSQPFGCTTFDLEPFDALCPWHHIHTGIDLAAPAGTEVHSATEGIAMVGFDPAGAGNFVAVTVDAHVRVLYCHLAAFRVAAGQAVTPGQVVGLLGATGLATGPHVHLQVNVDGRPVDPVPFLAS